MTFQVVLVKSFTLPFLLPRVSLMPYDLLRYAALLAIQTGHAMKIFPILGFTQIRQPSMASGKGTRAEFSGV